MSHLILIFFCVLNKFQISQTRVNFIQYCLIDIRDFMTILFGESKV